MYRLSYSGDNSMYNALIDGKIGSVRLIKAQSGFLVGVRSENGLNGFKYLKDAESLKLLWREKVFSQTTDGSSKSYPWWTSDVLGTGDDVIIIRQQTGLAFYRATENGLERLANDGFFHDVYGWKNANQALLIGRFFPNNDRVGVMTRDMKQEMKFYVLNKSNIAAKKPQPILQFKKDLRLAASFSSRQTEFMLAKWQRSGPETIVLRTETGLEFHQFDEKYELKKISATSEMAKSESPDRIFFANLTNQQHQEILHFNTSGLFVFQYDATVNELKVINYNPSFSERSGWISEYAESVKIVDLNADERDDIIFTGPDGITALTFDTETKKWRKLLDLSGLKSARKYATVVGVITTPSEHPLILTQDLNNKLLCAELIESFDKQDIEKVNTETSVTVSQPKWIDDDLQKFQIPFGKVAKLPEQSTRIPMRNKPVLRWTEQWDTSFMRQAVNSVSGQVQFKVPLVEVMAAQGLNVQLFASYDTQTTAAGLLGAGWSLLMPQDFIAVDNQESVFNQDKKYFISRQGHLQELKLQQLGEDLTFTVPGMDDATVHFSPCKQCWTIKTASLNLFYGKCNQAKNEDAVQWSLDWENWRGTGHDADLLKPQAVAWYLTEIRSSDHSLFYRYESESATIDGGKSYTTSIKLAEITDGKELSVNFDYGAKSSDEYVTPQPIESDGHFNFPVEQTPSYFLRGINVTTAAFKQNLKFNYQVEDSIRLLAGIDQTVEDRVEKVLQFDYEQIGKSLLLTKSTLPLGQFVSYKYEEQETKRVLKLESRHAITESSKIALGPNYTVVAHPDLIAVGETDFKVYDQAITKLVTQMKYVSKNSNGDEKVSNYHLHAFSNFFSLLLEFESTQELCLFHRQAGIWSKTPECFYLGQEAIVRFSDTMIAVADSFGLQILEWKSEQVSWKKTYVELSAIVSLVMHKNLIVAFDGSTLHLIYRDHKDAYNRKTLAGNFSAIDTMNGRVSNLFNVSDEKKKDFSKMIRHNSLHVYNNAILLHALDENEGQLSSHFHWILLDENYEIVQNEYHVIPRDNILDLEEIIAYDGSKFYIKYFQKDGQYELRIDNIDGKVYDDIKDIKNDNIKEDALEARLKELNDLADWKKHLRSLFLFDFSNYATTLQRKGIICGNDIIFRIGKSLHQEIVAPKKSITLGKHFILKSLDDDMKSLALLAQSNGVEGHEITKLHLNHPNQLINRYPAYLAYQSSSGSVILLSFKDHKTFGSVGVFDDESLHNESNLLNLLTVAKAPSNLLAHVASHELIVRPLASFMPLKKHAKVTLQTLSHGDVHRKTSYERTQHIDNDNDVCTEKISEIPGAERKISGWYEATRAIHAQNATTVTTEKWFDADGFEVQNLQQQKTEETSKDLEAVALETDSQLWDRSGKLLVCNFVPFSSKSDMVSYYGFESYELNESNGLSGSDVRPRWKFSEANVVRKGFSFTGENFLHLDGSLDDQLVGDFEPREQQMIYVASCWIRASERLVVDKHVSHLKAIVGINEGTELMTILAQVKRNFGAWSYIELLLDFSILKQAYEAYYDKNKSSDLPLPAFAKLKIKIKVSPRRGTFVDIDHIRFSPITQNFAATVYEPQTGLSTALIHSDGLISRTLLNHKNQEVAKFQGDGNLEIFSMRTISGKLVPALNASIQASLPCILKIGSESGFHESFDEVAWYSRWTLDNQTVWKAAPGQLMHKSPGKHLIKSLPKIFDINSSAFYCSYSLIDQQNSLHWVWSSNRLTIAKQSKSLSTLTLNVNEKIVTSLPSSGELLVLIEHARLIVWIDGVLAMDQTISLDVKSAAAFGIEAQGEVLIENFIIMNRPQIEVQYLNAWGETTQTLHLVDDKRVHLNEKLYDILGRPSITTQTTEIKRSSEQPLLAYHTNFVEKVNPSDQSSVWHTGRLQGAVDSLNPKNKGFAYTRVGFDQTPFNTHQVMGMSSPEFSIDGKFAKRFSNNSGIAFLDNLFPAKDGFRQQAEMKPNGSQHVAVFDKDNNKVAIYVHVPGFDHLFTTYEYDDSHNLVKILPPLYHEKVETAIKTEPWQPGNVHLTDQEKHWQKKLGTHLAYNSRGRLQRKITPDGGIVEILYTRSGQKRFMISSSSDEDDKQVTYFNYDSSGQLIETGFLEKSLSTKDLVQYLDIQDLPQAQTFQRLFHSELHGDPKLRNRLKRFMTYNEAEPVVEELYYDEQERISKKRIMVLPGTSSEEALMDIEKHYKAGRLHTLVYPSFDDNQPMYIVHSYNKRDQLEALGTPEDPNRYVRFTYHGNGQLASEKYQSSTGNFERNFSYSAPGFLEKITDKFFTEKLYYTEKGYGQGGFGDGIIMRTTFEASWSEEADYRSFQVKDSDLGDDRFSKLCIDALKRTGHLSSNGTPQKPLLKSSETSQPILCTGRLGNRLAEVLATKQPPKLYGHSYAYGNHKELVKAKYFTGESTDDFQPLQPSTFSKEIPKLSHEQSQQVWKLLKQSEYIISDQSSNDSAQAFGNRGRTFFREDELKKELEKFNTPNKDFSLYLASVARLGIKTYAQRKKVALSEFIDLFLHWDGLDDISAVAQDVENATQLYNMLTSKGFLANESKPVKLDERFTELLQNYQAFLPEIAGVLQKYFANSLGEAAFDVNSYKIDANGNHQKFYNGFNRYKFDYELDTNKIKSVTVNKFEALGSEKPFPIEYAMQGNIVKALHKNILNITYHPVSQRTTAIEMVDGRKLRFHYDAQGERVLKLVFDANGQMIQETMYLRDETGQVLMDRRSTFASGGTLMDSFVTTYLYGPRGLLGFFRNNDFYSVTTDHAGSVRLVIKNGQVVTAYDYMPYGELMRKYGNDPESHIMYQYTGQEFDEETGLYNYHARLYDPSIGRFFQPDPKAQYFSPYKYAGNSPVSMVDPDGEEAITIIAIAAGAIVGTYLGGAAVNNRWDPTDWDFKDGGTWAGMIGGGVTGAFIPGGVSASVAGFGGLVGATGASVFGIGATIAVGTGGAYLMTAAANDNWDPSEWEWDRPKTWNTLFQGFGAGVSVSGGVFKAHNYAAESIASASRPLFLRVSYGMAAAGMYGAGVVANDKQAAFWLWDWGGPKTYAAFVDGFGSGIGKPQSLHSGLTKGLGKLEKIAKNKDLMLKVKPYIYAMSLTSLTTFMTYYAAKDSFDNLFLNWDNLFSTYEEVHNEIFFGKDVTNMITLHTTDVRTIEGLSIRKFSSKNRNQEWSYASHRLLTNLLYLSFQKLGKKSSQSSSNSVATAKHSGTLWNTLEQPMSELLKFTQETARIKSTERLMKVAELMNLVQLDEERKKMLVLEKKVDFMVCGSEKRRRRQTMTSDSCKVPMRRSVELVEKLLSDGRDFAEAFQYLLRTLNSVVGQSFYTSFILGSLATLPRSVAKDHGIVSIRLLNKVIVCDYGEMKTTVEVQKLLFVYKDQGRTEVKLKMFVVDPIMLVDVEESYQEKWTTTLRKKSAINQEGLNGLTEIEVKLFRFTSRQDSIQVDTFVIKPDASEGDSIKNFKEVHANNDDLAGHLIKFADGDLESSLIKETKNFSESILKAYKNMRIALGITRTHLDFEAFLRGSLTMNFNEKIRIESIERCEFANAVLLSVRNNLKHKNWLATPIVIEFKSTNDITSRSYLNILSLKTLAKEAIIVEVDSREETVRANIFMMPNPVGFVEQLLAAEKHRIDASKLKAELDHLFYLTSNLEKDSKDSLYQSRMILGQLASRNDIKNAFVYPFEANKPTQVLFETSHGEWILLNIVEDRSVQTIGKAIVPESCPASKVTQVNLTLIVEFKDQCASFRPNIEVASNTVVTSTVIDGVTKIERFKAKNSAMDDSKELEKIFSSEKLMKNLAKMVQPFKSFINSERDFQAFAYGMFAKHPDTMKFTDKTVKVHLEPQLSKQGKNNLVMSVLDTSDLKNRKVIEDFTIVMELGFTNHGASIQVNDMLSSADDRLSEDNNFESIANRDRMVIIGAIYDKKSDSVKFRVGKNLEYHSSGHISGVFTSSEKKTSDDCHNKNAARKCELADDVGEKPDVEQPKYDKKVDTRQKRNIPGNFSSEEPVSTSSGSRLKFWPWQLMTNVVSTVIGYASVLFRPKIVFKSHAGLHVPQLEGSSESEYYTTTGDPSVMQMGDQWLSSTDLNGNLMWVTLLTRKFFGTSQIPDTTCVEASDPENNLLSVEIVEAFKQLLLSHAAESSMEAVVEDILNEIDLSKLSREIYHLIRNSDWDAISKLLHEEIVVKHLRKIPKHLQKQQQNHILLNENEILRELVELINLKINHAMQQRQPDGSVSQNILGRTDDHGTQFCLSEISKKNPQYNALRIC